MTNEKPIYVTDPTRAKALADYEKYIDMTPMEQSLYNQKRSKLYISDDGDVDVDTMKKMAETKEQAVQDYYAKQSAIRQSELEAERVESEKLMQSFGEYIVRKNEDKAQQEIAKAKVEADEQIERTVRHANNLKTEDEQATDNALKDMLKGLLG